MANTRMGPSLPRGPRQIRPHHSFLRKAAERHTGTLAGNGVAPPGDGFAQRDQDERAFEQTRVREDHTWLIDGQGPESEEVEVERPCLPTQSAPPAVPPLYLQEGGKQRGRSFEGRSRGEGHDRVEVIGLRGRSAHRNSAVDAGKGLDLAALCEFAARSAQMRERSILVAAQADQGELSRFDLARPRRARHALHRAGVRAACAPSPGHPSPTAPGQVRR